MTKRGFALPGNDVADGRVEPPQKSNLDKTENCQHASPGCQLLAAHPPVHECLGAPCATQVPDLRRVGEQDIPWRQFQHRLLRSFGNEGCRLGQRQPPVLRLAPWITANIAVVSLCKRHTKHLPIRSKGKLAVASPGGPSPEVGMSVVHPKPCSMSYGGRF